MKHFMIGFIIIYLCPTVTFSQIDTTSLSYYPLNDGDYWEYLEISTDFLISPPMTYFKYYSHEVTGDTIFPAAGKFKIIERKILGSPGQPTYYFERIDTVSCNVFRYDAYRDTVFLIDSLKAIFGDSCNAGRYGNDENIFKTYCTDFFSDTIFSATVFSKVFNEPKMLFYSEHRLTSGLGLTQSNIYPCFMSFITHLRYARINGVEYGTQINSIPQDKNIISTDFYLHQNYPNPFNPSTNIQFSIPKKEFVTLKIFNLLGKEVSTLVSGNLQAGLHTFIWDAKDVASGVYIIRLQGNNQSQIIKCVLIK